jgi:hypothetical protein
MHHIIISQLRSCSIGGKKRHGEEGSVYTQALTTIDEAHGAKAHKADLGLSRFRKRGGLLGMLASDGCGMMACAFSRPINGKEEH